MVGGSSPDLEQHPDLYDQLHALAQHCFKYESAAITLQPTALLHEAYARLASSDRQQWDSEEHFLAAAACVMRGVLIDSARRRNAQRRGGSWQRVELESILAESEPSTIDAVELDTHLSRLASEHPRAARIIELRFFGGLTIDQVANVLGISRRTVNLDWRFAQAWLRKAMSA